MRTRRVFWQLFPSFVIIVVLALLAATWYGLRAVRQGYLEDKKHDLESIARLAMSRLEDRFPHAEFSATDSLCKALGRTASVRITAILPDGRVVGDTDENPRDMDNHADRPEVMAALAGGVGSAVRYSHTVRQDMLYMAVPVVTAKATIGVVRASVSVTAIENVLSRIRNRIALGGVMIAALAALVSLLASRRISRPLQTMERMAERFAGGHFERKMPIPRIEEFARLAEAMNLMAEQLDERIRSLVEQRNQQDAVLSSMVEGVIAVDADERVLNVNAAAARLLDINLNNTHGRIVQEVVRNPELQDFLRRTLSSDEPVEGDIVLLSDAESGETQRFLQAHGTVLRDAQGKSIGALVVLNDVTRLHRLENVRREFIANVSHELKTPITSIKGFVETLLEGAVDNGEDARRFLSIIARHADRLHALVEDLLSLSRIEQEAERKEIALEPARLKPSLHAAIQFLLVKAQEKDIRIDLSAPADLSAKMNPPLLEQAVVNLVDNAIKYSDPGGGVEVVARASGSEVFIEVRDRGCGIEKEHLSRIFERFYRVDTGRSRKLGGTGLGLAIVKHIAQAHGGRVTVESTPGKGSVFTIHLPAT